MLSLKFLLHDVGLHDVVAADTNFVVRWYLDVAMVSSLTPLAR